MASQNVNNHTTKSNLSGSDLQLENRPTWRLRNVDLGWILLLLVLGGSLWLPGLGHRGVWTSGEARAAQVARRMVASGDYVTQRLQMAEPRLTVVGPEGDEALTYDPDGNTVVYEVHWRRALVQQMSGDAIKANPQHPPLRPEIAYEQRITIHKPILYYWLMAAAHRMGMEINAFTIRCFATVPAVLLLVVVYLLGCVLYERWVGLLAAAALATCVQFWWQARICQMDTLLALLMATTFLFWYIGDQSQQARTQRWAFGGVYLLLAAASLLKSFAYLLLAGLVVLVFIAAKTLMQHPRHEWVRAYRQRVWQIMRKMHIFAGAGLYLVLVIPWFVLIHQATDGQYTRQMFLTHMFSRAGLMQYGRELGTTTSWWFYLVRICVDLFPWVIMIPGAIVQVFRKRSRTTRLSSIYLLAWFVVWLLFFSAMPYRKNEYILPLYPAAMILVAKMLVDFIRDQATDIHLGRAIRFAFIGLAVGLVAAGACAVGLLNERFLNWVLPKLGTNRNDETALRTAASFFGDHLSLTITILVLLIAAMIAAVLLVQRRRTGTALVVLTAGTTTMLMIGTHVFVDRLIDPRRTQQVFAERLNDVASSFEAGPNKRLILFGTEQHELVYLMPNRFDSVPWVKPNAPFRVDPLYLLRSRLTAASSHALVVMEQEHWKMIRGQAEYLEKTWGEKDPFIHRFTRIPLGLERYEQTHREPLMILRYDPASSIPTLKLQHNESSPASPGVGL